MSRQDRNPAKIHHTRTQDARPASFDGGIEMLEARKADCVGSLYQDSERPDLIVDNGDLPATARDLRDLLARSQCLFDRGVPVKVVPNPNVGPPAAIRLTANRVVVEAHRLGRPVKLVGEELVPVTLPDRVTRMYLEMDGEWHLPTLAGICTAPVTYGSDPNSRPPSNEFTDHLRASESLSGAWRALDSQDRMVKLCRDANREWNGFLVSMGLKGSGSKSRRPGKQEFASSPILRTTRNTLLSHAIGDAKKSIGKHVRVHRRVREDSGRMHVSLRAALLYVDGASYAIDGVDAPKGRPVRQMQ
jgi:hypothetical protein